MTEFKLDTSGCVCSNGVAYSWDGDPEKCVVVSTPLSPFVQGCIEEAFRTAHPDTLEIHGSEDTYRQAGFSDLSPETLAMFMEDGVRAAAMKWPEPTGRHVWNQDESGGRCLWRQRQQGDTPNFPPLTLYLNDAGKIVHRVAT